MNNNQNNNNNDQTEVTPPLSFGNDHIKPEDRAILNQQLDGLVAGVAGIDPLNMESTPAPVYEQPVATENKTQEKKETTHTPKTVNNVSSGKEVDAKKVGHAVKHAIPTFTDKDSDIYTALSIMEKIRRVEEGKLTSRYKNDPSYREYINSMVTEKDNKFVDEKADVFTQINRADLTGSIDLSNVYLKGSSIDAMDFNKLATNNYPYGESTIGITTPRLGSGNIVDNVTAFKAAYRGTSIKVVNLIHSGFTIRINPPSVQDMILLNYILHKEEIRFAKDTATLINSSKRSYLLNPIITFVKEHIISHSLNVPANKDIMDFIDIRDYDIILAAFVTAMNGDSIFVNYRCANGYVWNEESNAPVCSSEYTLKLDMDKMLFIEKDFIPVEYLKQLTKKDANTVDVEELVEYKRQLDTRLEHLKSITIGNLIVTFKIPSIQEYLDSNLSYIEELKDMVSEANVAENELDRENILKRMMNIGYGMEVTNSIEKMEILGKNVTLTKHSAIADFISGLDNEVSKLIYDACKLYLEEAVVAKICYPKSYCQTCLKDRPESIEDFTTSLKQLTPINMLGFFSQAIYTHGI